MERLDTKFQQVIRERIHKIMEEETDNAVATAAQNIKHRIKAEADNIALSMARYYDIAVQRDRIVITVKKEID